MAELNQAHADRLDELADRIAAEINDRASKLTAEERAQADSETYEGSVSSASTDDVCLKRAPRLITSEEGSGKRQVETKSCLSIRD